MTIRPILALAAAAALALPAVALADNGPSTQSGPVNPPACGAASARSDGQPSPCSVRVCNSGQASTPQVPCVAPCAPNVRPTPQAPCAPVPAGQQHGQGTGDGQDGPQQQGGNPTGDGNGNGNGNGGGNAFGLIRSRVWRMTAEADGFDTSTHALAVVVDQVGGLNTKLANKLENALGDQVEVLVNAQTRVLDANGHRLSAADAPDALDAANNVKVTGKLLAPSAWVKDVDGTPLPTMRALRIAIVS